MHLGAALTCLGLSAAFLILAAACGSDDAADPDAAPTPDAAIADAAPPDSRTMGGSATITGTIAETTITPVNVFAMTHPLVNIPILVMHEDPAVFCEVTDSDEHVIVIGFHCAPAEVGTRDVAEIGDIDCQNATEDWVLAEGFTGEFTEVGALSGQVTIDSVGDMIAGSFNANFGVDDDLAGTFEAIVCP